MTALPAQLPRLCFSVALALLPAGGLLAHVDDESAMRMRLEPRRMELRLTFHLLTLGRFVPLDADGDAAVSKSELDNARPRLADYLRKHVAIEVNAQPAVLSAQPQFDYIWPHADNFPPVPLRELSSRYVDVIFTHDTSPALLEDVWLGFDIFEHAGPLHTVRGVFEQDGQLTEAPFSLEEPDYLYDTDYADHPPAQPPAVSKSAAAPETTPPPGNRIRTLVLALAALMAAVFLLALIKRR